MLGAVWYYIGYKYKQKLHSMTSNNDHVFNVYNIPHFNNNFKKKGCEQQYIKKKLINIIYYSLRPTKIWGEAWGW